MVIKTIIISHIIIYNTVYTEIDVFHFLIVNNILLNNIINLQLIIY